MTKTVDFDRWLEKFDDAWQSANAKKASSIFTKNAIYFENPLEQPLTSKREIENVWEQVSKTQRGIKVKSEVYMVKENTCVAHFKASFFRITTNSIVKLDGIYIFTLNEMNLCTEFHFWWVPQEEKIE